MPRRLAALLLVAGSTGAVAVLTAAPASAGYPVCYHAGVTTSVGSVNTPSVCAGNFASINCQNITLTQSNPPIVVNAYECVPLP